MKNFKYIVTSALLTLCFQASFSQIIINANSQTRDLQLEKKMATTDDVVGIGEYFYYEIAFLDLNAANTSLEISDVIPAGLEYVSYEALIGSFLNVSGTPPNNFDPGSSPVLVGPVNDPINANGQKITFTNLDNYTQGIFRIKVRFPDSTCNGATVTNNACAIYTNNTTGNVENICTTSGLTSRAEGIDPWAKVTKKPMYPAVFDANGNWYVDINNPIVKYKITIEKKSPHENETSGMLGLSNITIEDVLLSGGNVLNVTSTTSPSSTFTQNGNDITVSDIWSGNTNSFKKEFIIEVDYSGATPLAVGQTITNTVNLRGQTCVDAAPKIKGTATADVIVTDTLPAILPSKHLLKTVQMTNRVVGCVGTYQFMYKNTNNRPISNVVITDNLPDDIEPFGQIQVIPQISLGSSAFTAEFNNAPLLPGNIFPASQASGNTIKISADPTTVLQPYDYVMVQFNYTLRSAPPNGIITNCVNATGEINVIDPNTGVAPTIISDSHCESFQVENPAPKICINKQVRKIQTGYTGPWTYSILDAKPGDELEFRVRIVNNGSSQFTNGTLTDVLDPKYIFQSFVNTPSGVTANQVGQNLDWSNINISSDCTVSPYASCSTSLPHVDITFKVKVEPYTPPGQIDNRAALSGNIINATSNNASVRVVNSFVIKMTKEISKNGLVWTDHLVETPGYSGTIQYRLRVENIGNMPVTNHEIYDELPFPGDVYFPTLNSRGSNFALNSPINLLSSPNYSANVLNSAGRVDTCGDPVSGLLSSSNTIKYVSNSVLNPTDVFEMKYSGTLPTGLTTGNKAVNSAYFLDCTGYTNIITPSEIATLEIYEPPCATCPEGSQWQGNSVSNSVVTIPETGVHSELDGIPVYNENIQLQTNWQWVTGVRIIVSEFEPIYGDGCESCHFNMDQVGNLVNNMFPAKLGQLDKMPVDYHGANPEFVREIVYKGLPDISFRSGVSTNIAISLPDMLNTECCVVSYKACIKYIFEGPNCENCEVEYCFTAPDGPIHPVLCPEPTVEIVELGKPDSDCCQKVLKPYISPCKIGAIYEWIDPLGNSTTGTTNKINDGRLTATMNGDYTLKVQCQCPDGTITVATATHTVSGLLGPPPTTSGIVSHTMRRYRSGANYTASLDFSISPAFYKYGFNIKVQQSYLGNLQIIGAPRPQRWRNINQSIFNKDVCAENGTDFKVNFPYNQPGSNVISGGGQLQYSEGNWQDNYRIVIEWEGCNSSSTPIDFPITNLPPIGIIYNPPNGGGYQTIPGLNLIGQ